MSLDNPLPERPRLELFLRKNIINQALEYHKYLKSKPARSYSHVSRRFGVTRARVSQLLSLIERLPKRFIQRLEDCKEQRILEIYSGRKLLKITRSKNPRQVTSEIHRLERKFSSLNHK